MKRIIVALILVSTLLISFPFGLVSAEGDTGTYQIQEYDVVLTPHFTGEVEISYTQKWLVTGGHIPWVTVGLPNSDFEIISFGGAAKEVNSANEGNWFGVRVDLDKDYQPQEVFQFNFSIIQHALFERKAENYSLVYTPGWYDRCVTDLLTIKVISFVKVENLTISPQATSITKKLEGDEILWERNNLGRGEKFTISVEFSNESLAPSSREIRGSQGDDGLWLWIIVISIGIFILVVIIGAAAGSSGSSSSYSSDDDDDDDDNGHSHGGSSYGGAIIHSGSRKGGKSGGSSTGGGGGFGGRGGSCVCVCACVSCACACACAGGGGAGCSRKMYHSCSRCEKKVEKNETR